MKFTGKESVSIQVEKNEKPEFCWSCIDLYNLLNFAIRDTIMRQLRKDEVKRFKTDYFKVEDLKISKGTKIDMRFLTSLEKDPFNMYPEKFTTYITNLDVSDLYNKILDLYEEWAYELDTDVDNIKLELVRLEIRNDMEDEENGK